MCGDRGRFANGANMVSQCARFLLGREEAQSIITEMKDHIRRNWLDIARKAGVTIKDCELISLAFVYPGFDF